MVRMHDIERMVEKEIMKSMFTVHTLRRQANDTPPNNGICVIVLFAVWTKRTRGLGRSPNGRQGKRYGALSVQFHVRNPTTRVLTKASVLRMTSEQLEKNFDRWWYSTHSIFRHYIFSLFPKNGVARCFGLIMFLYSWEILYVSSKNHFWHDIL